jgi:hypothetical protein
MQQSSANHLEQAAHFCDEWWQVTYSDNINSLDQVFTQDELRRSVRQALISMLLGVTCIYSFSVEQITLSSKQVRKIKKMLFYIH